MKNSELIELLQKLPPDLEVVLQKDSEGNGYKFAGGAEVALREPSDREYRIDFVYDLDWSAKDAGMDEDEWEEAKETYQKILIIYP